MRIVVILIHNLLVIIFCLAIFTCFLIIFNQILTNLYQFKAFVLKKIYYLNLLKY